MKKRILLFTAITGLGYLSLTSYKNGPADGGQNRTGAKSSAIHCGGSGCHNSGVNTSTNVDITVDSATTTGVTSYSPGKVYTVKIHGTNTLLSYAKFGFSFASVKGSGSSQTQAGTASALPASVAAHSFSSLTFIEHSAPITSPTAGVYDVTFQWTAPAAGTGSVTMYCTLNAVDGDGSAGSLDMSRNTSLVLTERPTTAVATITGDLTIKVYPNPATTTLNLQIDNAPTGTYAMQVFDMSGRIISSENISVSGANHITGINTSNWANGIYMLVLQKDGVSKTIQVVKK